MKAYSGIAIRTEPPPCRQSIVDFDGRVLDVKSLSLSSLAAMSLVVEFSDASPSGASAVEVPRGWIGTVTPVRVSFGAECASLLLGQRAWSGPASHGIFVLAGDVALVVVGGTGYLVKAADDGGLSVAALRIWPILDVVEDVPLRALALVSEQEIELLTPIGRLEVPIHATDGFRGVLLGGGSISCSRPRSTSRSAHARCPARSRRAGQRQTSAMPRRKSMKRPSRGCCGSFAAH